MEKTVATAAIISPETIKHYIEILKENGLIQVDNMVRSVLEAPELKALLQGGE